jgi:hypothetical protein
VPTLLAVSRPKTRHALEEPFTNDPISECPRRSRAPTLRSVSHRQLRPQAFRHASVFHSRARSATSSLRFRKGLSTHQAP